MATRDGIHIDIDLEFARSEAQRIQTLLEALRRRHDLTRYEYTRVIRIVPGGDTFAHPSSHLATGLRAAKTAALTYLHEQMHWYLWLKDTPQVDPIAPFYDELVRRYPQAPHSLPDGARNYEATYVHLVVNWLGNRDAVGVHRRERAEALARAQDELSLDLSHRACGLERPRGALCQARLLPIRPAPDLIAANAPLAAPREKPAQDLGRLRLRDPAQDLGRVVAGRRVKSRTPFSTAPPLGSPAPKVEPRIRANEIAAAHIGQGSSVT